MLTETWQSELVVTTFHQLLYSLLSPRNANLKRAGQLTGALVLLDEVQALPLRYWEALRQLFLAAARSLGTRFVLLTATRPLIFQPGDAVELLPDHAEHFQALTRTRLVLPSSGTAGGGRICRAIDRRVATDARATLIIVNRRRAVRDRCLRHCGTPCRGGRLVGVVDRSDAAGSPGADSPDSAVAAAGPAGHRGDDPVG